MALIFTANTDDEGRYLPGAPFLLAAVLTVLAIIVFSIGARMMPPRTVTAETNEDAGSALTD